MLNHSIVVSLTATGDLLVLLIAAVVIELGVRVVQDGPALWVLHGITVTLVVHLAASMGQKTSQTQQVLKWTNLNAFFLWV